MAKIVANLTEEQIKRFKAIRDEHLDLVVGLEKTIQSLGAKMTKAKNDAWEYIYSEFPLLDRNHNISINERRGVLVDEHVKIITEEDCAKCDVGKLCVDAGVRGHVLMGEVPCPAPVIRSIMKLQKGLDKEVGSPPLTVTDPKGRTDN